MELSRRLGVGDQPAKRRGPAPGYLFGGGDGQSKEVWALAMQRKQLGARAMTDPLNVTPYQVHLSLLVAIFERIKKKKKKSTLCSVTLNGSLSQDILSLSLGGFFFCG